jgi:hypothetical protein
MDREGRVRVHERVDRHHVGLRFGKGLVEIRRDRHVELEVVGQALRPLDVLLHHEADDLVAGQVDVALGVGRAHASDAGDQDLELLRHEFLLTGPAGSRRPRSLELKNLCSPRVIVAA